MLSFGNKQYQAEGFRHKINLFCVLCICWEIEYLTGLITSYCLIFQANRGIFLLPFQYYELLKGLLMLERGMFKLNLLK